MAKSSNKARTPNCSPLAVLTRDYMRSSCDINRLLPPQAEEGVGTHWDRDYQRAIGNLGRRADRRPGGKVGGFFELPVRQKVRPTDGGFTSGGGHAEDRAGIVRDG